VLYAQLIAPVMSAIDQLLAISATFLLCPSSDP
jgi:hypothetical protein